MANWNFSSPRSLIWKPMILNTHPTPSIFRSFFLRYKNLPPWNFYRSIQSIYLLKQHRIHLISVTGETLDIFRATRLPILQFCLLLSYSFFYFNEKKVTTFFFFTVMCFVCLGFPFHDHPGWLRGKCPVLCTRFYVTRKETWIYMDREE